MEFNIPKDNINYLRNVYEAVKKYVLDNIKPRNLCSIIIFGSAARPQDFVIGVSDIDVLVLTREECEKRSYRFIVYNSRVDVIILAIDEFKILVEYGDPLTFMLKYKVILYNNCGDVISSCRPKITERTKHILRRSIFAALSLSLENYYIKRNYIRALSHLYHSIRHLARYKSSLKGVFPVSDEEVYENTDPPLKNLYMNLTISRRGKDVHRIREFIDKAIELIGIELGIKYPELKLLDEVKGSIELIIAWEIYGNMIFRVEFYKDYKRKIIEIRGNEVREVESIFPV